MSRKTFDFGASFGGRASVELLDDGDAYMKQTITTSIRSLSATYSKTIEAWIAAHEKQQIGDPNGLDDWSWLPPRLAQGRRSARQDREAWKR